MDLGSGPLFSELEEDVVGGDGLIVGDRGFASAAKRWFCVEKGRVALRALGHAVRDLEGSCWICCLNV